MIGTDGVVVVDTKNPGWGQPILDKIKRLTNKPVTTIINTHTHGDHVSGNVEFPTTVEVIAHENNKINMQTCGPRQASPARAFNKHLQGNQRPGYAGDIFSGKNIPLLGRE